MSLSKKKQGLLMMAFASGSESKENIGASRYVGVGVVKVIAVNPTKAELEKIYNREFENEPEYVTVKDGVKSARVSFVVKTVPEKNNGIDTTATITYFLRDEMTSNKDNTKLRVIDKYGETTWVTKEEYKAGLLPSYSQRVILPYKGAYIGEENLIKFLKAFINIPDSTRYKDGAWVQVANLGVCEASLEKISNYFKGDFSELKQIIKLQPDNMMRLLFGVRTTPENKTYQSFFTETPMKYGVRDYNRLDKEVKESKNAGRYADTEFMIGDLKVYEETPTKFSAPEVVSDLPFDADEDSTTPWFVRH